jgi:starch synthase
LRVALVASEVYPFARTGGLADVLCSLPAALERSGHQVSLFIPFYRSLGSLPGIDWMPPCRTMLGEEFGLGRILHPDTGTPVYLISRDSYFDREGIYGPPEGGDYPDNSLRFSFFCRAVAAAVCSLRFRPDVLHCHDWHTGLIPAYLLGTGPATVFTIHNLAYQGNFPIDQYILTGLPEPLLEPDVLGYRDGFSFMKAGIVMADAVSTVSPSYAREIQTSVLGMGMESFIRHRASSGRNRSGVGGILNGIDFEFWDPGRDSSIAAGFSPGFMGGKKRCRSELCRELGIDEPADAPLAGIVSRLIHQKGIDLLFPVADRLIESGISLVALGSGENGIESGLVHLQDLYPDRISITIGYDDSLARKIFAGSDIFLMPSRFEPCGLAQMMAMRYGSVPVVRATGGLADTVLPASGGGTGFVFGDDEPGALLEAVMEASSFFRNKRKWAWVRRRCMLCNNSWNNRVGEYEQLYLQAVQTAKGG